MEGYKEQVKTFNRQSFVPKFMENRFSDLQIKYCHLAFAKFLANRIMPYIKLSQEQQVTYQSQDSNLRNAIPLNLHGSYFHKVMQNAYNDYTAVEADSEKNLRYAVFKVFNEEDNQSLVQTHKSMLNKLYETMGVGITFQHSEQDQPKRLYKLS
jgi:hypothetical protein